MHAGHARSAQRLEQAALVRRELATQRREPVGGHRHDRGVGQHLVLARPDPAADARAARLRLDARDLAARAHAQTRGERLGELLVAVREAGRARRAQQPREPRERDAGREPGQLVASLAEQRPRGEDGGFPASPLREPARGVPGVGVEAGRAGRALGAAGRSERARRAAEQ